MKLASIKFLALLLIIIAALTAAFSLESSVIDPEDIGEIVRDLGYLAPVVFIFFASIAAATFFPGTVFTVAGGILFGPLMGTIYSVTSAVIGATIGFWITRFLGEPFISQYVSDKSGKIEEYKAKIEKESFSIVFILRLIPLVPFVLLTLAAGLSRVKFRHFILATFLGIIPGTFIYSYAGSAFASLDPMGIIVSGLLLIILIAAGLLYRSYHPELVEMRRKRKEVTNNHTTG